MSLFNGLRNSLTQTTTVENMTPLPLAMDYKWEILLVCLHIFLSLSPHPTNGKFYWFVEYLSLSPHPTGLLNISLSLSLSLSSSYKWEILLVC